MRGFLARLLITAFGLWAAAVLVSGVDVVGVSPLLIAALVLGIVGGAGRIERFRRVEVSGRRVE